MKLIFSTILFFIYSINILAFEITFRGLNKLTLDDIQYITPSEDILKNKFNEVEINNIVRDLYQNDLIYDALLTIIDENAIIDVIESKVIENIYINGNISFEDDLILENLTSKVNSPLVKSNITNDISLIKKIYKSLGYTNIDIKTVSESYSKDRVNLIFDISEGKISKIIDINFIGNNFFSDKYLNNLISSEARSVLDIFNKGSNFDSSFFIFDSNKIINTYEDYGFFDSEVTYQIKDLANSNYILTFYINENDRLLIKDVKYEYISLDLKENFKKLEDAFNKILTKESNYYNINQIQNHLSNLNQTLDNNNLFHHDFKFSIDVNSGSYILTFFEDKLDPLYINKIYIDGNTITKDLTIRSKLSIEPGDFYNPSKLDVIKKDLIKLKYINQIDIDPIVNNDKLVDISLNIEENKKTGNFLLGGSFSGDTGFGFGLGIKDFNIFGSGNSIDANFNLNSEQTLFALNYTQYPLSKINLKNNYSLFNSEKDLTDSYGYKVDEKGFGYGISYQHNKNIDISYSFKLSNYKGHSGSNNNTVVTDNIGDRNLFNLNLSISRDTTNDIWYPTNGSKNKFSLSLNPENLSDDPYYKMVLSSDFYRKRKNNQNFFFLSNRIGLSESLSGNLNTANVFSLGGMNFKGFDYRGVGPFEGKIYLGGNKFFTSTVGYGGSFIFDQKDNINVKVFATTGSIWESDYSNDDSFDIRSSVGVSFDIMSVIPISLTYAIPIDKKSTDKTREFNFAIGTSF